MAARRKDARSVTIKKQKNGSLKFKVRCSKYLYTLVVKDNEKADKLQQSLPPGTSVLPESPPAGMCSRACPSDTPLFFPFLCSTCCRPPAQVHSVRRPLSPMLAGHALLFGPRVRRRCVFQDLSSLVNFKRLRCCLIAFCETLGHPWQLRLEAGRRSRYFSAPFPLG